MFKLIITPESFQGGVGECATSPTAGMPSRVLATREDGTSTTSTSPSYQSASPGLESESCSPEDDLQSKSGTQRRRSQSIVAGETDLSSLTAAAHHHSQASTPANPGAIVLGSKSEIGRRPTSSPSSLQASIAQRSQPPTSYFVRQPRASGLDARSPFTRRAPASRSSHGIETLSGPPPALITQRSYTGDNLWRYTLPVDGSDPTLQGSSGNFSVDTRDIPTSIATSCPDSTASENLKKSKTEMASTKRARDGTSVEEDQDQVTLRGTDSPRLGDLGTNNKTGNERYEKQSESSHEDLFLNLAQADSAAGADSDRSYSRQRRRVRYSLVCPT